MENYKGKLILCSSGVWNQHEETPAEKVQEKMFKACAEGKNVLIVLNATDTGSNPLGKQHSADAFYKLGAKSVTEKSISAKDFDTFSNFDLIYFMGGDCYPLIKLASTKGIKTAIINYLKFGGTIIGQSAGTLFFTKDLKYYYDAKKGTKAKYDIPLKSYKGLGLVNEIFFPHYNAQAEFTIKKIDEIEKANKISFTKMIDGEYYIYNVDDLLI